MKTGDIVLIPFPFAELTNVKLRPAVVVSETKDRYRDLIVCAISSQVPVTISPAEIVLNPDGKNGLRVVSILKVDRIFTLKQERVVAVLGNLSAHHLQQFKEIFAGLVQ